MQLYREGATGLTVNKLKAEKSRHRKGVLAPQEKQIPKYNRARYALSNYQIVKDQINDTKDLFPDNLVPAFPHSRVSVFPR